MILAQQNNTVVYKLNYVSVSVEFSSCKSLIYIKYVLFYTSAGCGFHIFDAFRRLEWASIKINLNPLQLFGWQAPPIGLG